MCIQHVVREEIDSARWKGHQWTWGSLWKVQELSLGHTRFEMPLRYLRGDAE